MLLLRTHTSTSICLVLGTALRFWNLSPLPPRVRDSINVRSLEVFSVIKRKIGEGSFKSLLAGCDLEYSKAMAVTSKKGIILHVDMDHFFPLSRKEKILGTKVSPWLSVQTQTKGKVEGLSRHAIMKQGNLGSIRGCRFPARGGAVLTRSTSEEIIGFTGRRQQTS